MLNSINFVISIPLLPLSLFILNCLVKSIFEYANNFANTVIMYRQFRLGIYYLLLILNGKYILYYITFYRY